MFRNNKITMKKLITQIKNSSTIKELENIIFSMPNQENGFPTKLQRILENAFWYYDLTELESIKKWMLIRVNFYTEPIYNDTKKTR